MIAPIKHLLLFALAGSRGGITRVRILKVLEKSPCNMHQLSKKLKLDYKTVQHHINVLRENHLISTINKGKYGALFIISEELEQNKEDLNKILAKFGKDLGKNLE